MNVDAVVNLQLLGATFVTLFVIMDPPGTVPIFLGLTSKMDGPARSRAARQASRSWRACVRCDARGGVCESLTAATWSGDRHDDL